MSQTNQLNYDSACNLLLSNVYAPVFFDKLANDYGIRPTSEAEEQEYLALAGKLLHAEELSQQKQASERVSLISAVNKNVDELLNRASAPARSPSDIANDYEVKAAAEQLSQVPQLRDAALLYQDAMKQLLSGK
jgi:hypothetical protein